MASEAPKPPFHVFRFALTRSTAKEGIQGIELDESVAGATSENVRRDALRLLGFVEEYFAATEHGRAGEHLALAGEDDLEALLAQLEAPAQEAEGLEATKDRVRIEIARLLANPEVKADFFAILEAESAKFRAAKSTLKKVQDRNCLMELILRRTTAMCLEDVRKKGKLQESTRTAIAALEGRRNQAQMEIQQTIARADFNTKSLLYVQELLGYKRELREHGFATTPSRKLLLDRVLSGVAHGEKMFLVGSTGTGKTQLAMLVADLVSNGYELVSWHEGTTPRDLFGYREIGQENGELQSYIKPGPVAISIEKGRIVIHDEYTNGSTRVHISAKAEMNVKPGHVVYLNGKMVTAQEGYGEIFTGNLKDGRTKARENMDPAILRMLSGVKVGFMPADELFKVVLAEMMDELGYLSLSPQDVELIRRMTQAAELMQMCHDRELEGLSDENKALIVNVFGGRMDEVHLDKSFLDTGTLLRMFAGWDLEQAKGRTFAQFLLTKVQHFLADPKFDMDRQERKLARLILQMCNVLDSTAQSLARPPLDAAVWGQEQRELILPSEIGKLFGEKLQDDVGIEEDPEADEAALAAAQAAVLGLLNPSGVEGRPDVQKQIENQIAEALALLDLIEIGAGDKNPPRVEEVSNALKAVTEVQWAEIAKFKEPTLLIVPQPASLPRFEKVINNQAVKSAAGAKGNAFFSEMAQDAFVSTVQAINGYSFVITDGAADVTDQGEWNQAQISGNTPSNKGRMDLYNAHFIAKSMPHLDVPAYVFLQARAMQKGSPLDPNTLTLLGLAKNGRVACGFWFNDRAGFGGDDLGVQVDGARLRASVMGKI